VPLVATSATNGDAKDNTGHCDGESVDILGHFPSKEEWAEVARVSGTKEIKMTPEVQVTAVGTGVQMAGVGMNWSGSEERSYKICLNPQLKAMGGHPMCLRW
jgi:hypothetical protein